MARKGSLMSMYGDITDSVWAWSQACTKDLYEINEVWRDKTTLRRPYPNEIEVISFPQSWPSTNLGFSGGVAGQAISTAQTTVCLGPNGDAAVYCGKRLMYHISHYNDKFITDLYARNMVRQGHHRIYENVTQAGSPPEPKADQPC